MKQVVEEVIKHMSLPGPPENSKALLVDALHSDPKNQILHPLL